MSRLDLENLLQTLNMALSQSEDYDTIDKLEEQALKVRTKLAEMKEATERKRQSVAREELERLKKLEQDRQDAAMYEQEAERTDRLILEWDQKWNQEFKEGQDQLAARRARMRAAEAAWVAHGEQKQRDIFARWPEMKEREKLDTMQQWHKANRVFDAAIAECDARPIESCSSLPGCEIKENEAGDDYCFPTADQAGDFFTIGEFIKLSGGRNHGMNEEGWRVVEFDNLLSAREFATFVEDEGYQVQGRQDAGLIYVDFRGGGLRPP